MMTDSYRMSYIPYFFFVFSSEMMSNSWKCRIRGYICSLKWCIYILALCLLILILNIHSYSLLLQNMIKRIQSMIILSHNTLWFVKLWFFLLLFTFFSEEYFICTIRIIVILMQNVIIKKYIQAYSLII